MVVTLKTNIYFMMIENLKQENDQSLKTSNTIGSRLKRVKTSWCTRHDNIISRTRV